MSNQRPTFSIVVPIYNEEKYIKEALDSILAQTDPDWEALLVDDGSTDATPGILDKYAASDARFRVFHKPNGGQSTAINKGVEEARGDWLCWLSGDDFFHPKKLEFNRGWILEYPEKKFFFSGHWLIEPDGNTIDYNLDWLNLEKSAYHLITLFRCNYVMGISICVERVSWVRNGGFDESLRHAHDLDMWLRLMINTPTQYLPDRTCTMRYHAGQETARFPMAPLFDVAKSVIRLINDHPFQDLFPGVNLADYPTALDVFSRALDFVASEPTCNYYALGYHPALLMRILEWLWDPLTETDIACQLRSMLRAKAENIYGHYSIPPFTLLWKAARVAIDQPAPRFVYQPSNPAMVGEIHYYYQRAIGSEVAISLRTYLEQYDGVKFTDEQPIIFPGRELVLIFPGEIALDQPTDPYAQMIGEICQELIRAGLSILLIGKLKNTFGLVYGLPALGAENDADYRQLLESLGSLDIVVALSSQEALQWTNSKCKFMYPIPTAGKAGIEAGQALVLEIQSRLTDSQIDIEKKSTNDALLNKVIRKLRKMLSKQ